MYIALVLLGVLEDDFYNGGFFPIIEFPLHLDVLSLTQGQVFALDLALKDGE